MGSQMLCNSIDMSADGDMIRSYVLGSVSGFSLCDCSGSTLSSGVDPGNGILGVEDEPFTLTPSEPIMIRGGAQSHPQSLTRCTIEMSKRTQETASDYLDTPAYELPVLASKRRVQELLGNVLRFAEPARQSKPPANIGVTERQVKDMLRAVDCLHLDELVDAQKVVG